MGLQGPRLNGNSMEKLRPAPGYHGTRASGPQDGGLLLCGLPRTALNVRFSCGVW